MLPIVFYVPCADVAHFLLMKSFAVVVVVVETEMFFLQFLSIHIL